MCYRSPVFASPDKVAGFALGALLAGDREAATVEQQLPAAFHAAVRARLAEVQSASDAQGKREALATLIARVRPEPASLHTLPRAAQALLQRTNTRGTNRLRSDYQLDADLVAMLKRLAARLEARESG